MRKVNIGTFDCTPQDISAVVKVMAEGYISAGKELDEFEKSFSEYHGKKHGVMVNSGQSALEVALMAAKVALQKPQPKVIVPATTYAATLWAVLNTGCEPVFVDVTRDYNIDWGEILAMDIEADIILAVDLCGKDATPENLAHFKTKYFIIEDACEACGNKNANYGHISCFSFYVSHIITSGSGGMVCFDDAELAEWARSYIAHGRAFGGDFTKYEDKWVNRFFFDKVGTSWRSDNISAALALSQFQRLQDIVDARKYNAKELYNKYQNSDILKYNFRFPQKDYYDNCVFQFFPILIVNPKIDREDLLSYLYENGIDSRVLLNLIDQPIFKTLYGDVEYLFENSEFINKNGFIVGCHQNLNEIDMRYIIEVLTDYCRKNKYYV